MKACPDNMLQSAAHEILKHERHILRLGNDDVYFVDGRICEHLGKSDILAELRLHVQSVTLRRNEFNGTLALFEYFKEFCGVLDVLDFHFSYLFLFLFYFFSFSLIIYHYSSIINNIFENFKFFLTFLQKNIMMYLRRALDSIPMLHMRIELF